MPHRRLRRPQGHAATAQEGAEGRPKGVDIERPAPVVPFRDSRRTQVPVEDADQPRRHVEDGGFRGKVGRQGLATAASYRLKSGKTVGEPGAKVFRQVGADDDAVPFPALLVGGVEVNVRNRGVEPQVEQPSGSPIRPYEAP